MRIVGGKHKGRKLFEPKDYAIRPTADKVRESLFNILGQRINGSFLDLFGGSGAVGLEALSRGAEVTINDCNKTSYALIKKNLELIKESAEVLNLDCMYAIKHITRSFDLIFLDPPYALDIKPIINALLSSCLLKESTIIIYEHLRANEAPNFDKLEISDERFYGTVALCFYKIKSTEEKV